METVFEEITEPTTEPKKGDERTERCPKHGDYVATYHGGFGGLYARRWTSCQLCQDEYEAARDEASKRRQRRDDAARCLCRSNIPIRHRRKTLDNFKPQTDDQRAALEAAKLYVENFTTDHLKVGRCLSFIGPVGTGKTHLACAVIAGVAEQGRVVKYITASDLIYEIRATWHRGSDESAQDVMSRYSSPHLLLIDDVGCMAAEYEHVRHLLEKRYNDKLPTMITSNMGPNELASYIDPRGVDRLRENGGLMFALSGSSRRANPELTVIDEPLWWERWLDGSACARMELAQAEDEAFSVNIQDFPGLCSSN